MTTPSRSCLRISRRTPGARPIRVMSPTVHCDSAQTGALTAAGAAYSHSMVPGGFDVMSRVTRFTSRTSLVMRVEILASTS